MLNKLSWRLTFARGFVVIFISLIFVTFVYHTGLMENMELDPPFTEFNICRNLNGVPRGYLVFSSGCQIPDYNPFSQEVLNNLKKQNYTDCVSNEKPLTRLVDNLETESLLLIIDENVKTEIYGSAPIICCYCEIIRHGTYKTTHIGFNISKCNLFYESIQLPSLIEHLIVRCKGTEDRDPIYVNAHFVVRKRADVEQRIQRMAKKKSKKPLSVLLIGIDSISRLNLMRSMPQTREYLFKNKWFELMGYNKIGDNKFPNLMAILTGYNFSMVQAKCDLKKFSKLQTCPLIWKDFHDNGYATAYTENEVFGGRFKFNYLNYGFVKHPTDYYMRPIQLLPEQSLSIMLNNKLIRCLSYTHFVDYMFDYAIEFAKTFKKQPHFGLFWTNLFNGEKLGDPSEMDSNIRNYLRELSTTGVLDESMVVFFSDGMRYDPTRQTDIDWFEERLPFMFISLPKWFRIEYSEFVQSLLINQNRLTTPYDIHMTLKHIVEISSPEYAADNINYLADGCKQCQSIFYDIPINRTCLDAKIELDWCACVKTEPIDFRSSFIQNGFQFIIDYMNTIILVDYLAGSSAKNTSLLDKGKSCAQLQLKEIKFIKRIIEHGQENDNYLVMYETTPGDGLFETTLSYIKHDNKFQIISSISRLNRYGNQNRCVWDVKVIEYCYCVDDL